MLRIVPIFWIVSCGALFSCSTSSVETFVLLSFVPSQDVIQSGHLGEVETLELMLDATEGGFVGIETLPLDQQEIRATDVDGDGQDELLYTMSISNPADLPILRLDPGDNLQKLIRLSVQARDSHNTLLAYGGFDARTIFSASQVNHIKVPMVAPRSLQRAKIIAVSPHSVPAGGSLLAVAFYATSALDESTFSGNISLEIVQNGQPTPVPVLFFDGPITCPFQTEMWVVTPASCVPLAGASSVRLTINNSVLDSNGFAVLGPTQQPGFEHSFALPNASGLGPCTGLVTTCDQHNLGSVDQRSDLVCGFAGMFEPSPCAIAQTGCLSDDSVFSWASAAQCQGFRDDIKAVDDFCTLVDPWTCESDTACAFLDNSLCQTNGNCKPPICALACSQPSLYCVEGGCVPRLGGCAQNCSSSGVCPEFSEQCLASGSNTYLCQQAPSD